MGSRFRAVLCPPEHVGWWQAPHLWRIGVDPTSRGGSWPALAPDTFPFLSQVWLGFGPEQALPVFGQLSSEATLSVFCP